jgi:hypothetical protein
VSGPGGREIAIFTADSSMNSCTFARDSWMIVVGDNLGRVHFLRLVEADPTKPAIGETKIQLLQHKQLGTDL